MKQKNCFFAVAASMLIAAASFTSCSNQDNIVAPEQPADYSFDEGSLIINGQCESSDASNFWVHEWRTPDAQTDGPANLKWDEETPKNHCAIVEVRSQAEAQAAGNMVADGDKIAAWDSQFFITFGEGQQLNPKDQIRLTMRVKADEAATVGTQSHAAPGAYMHWYCVGDVNFTPEWTDYDSGWVTAGNNSWGQAQQGMYTIAFNLSTGIHNRYFFDDMRVEVKRFIPDPEPTQIDGYQVVFWDWGTAAQDKYSVKYFKNYTAAKSEDGAVVVESLEPGKNYTPQYYMADNNGNEIDAVLANNWDTQFLISLSQPLAKGTKVKFVAKVKADKAAGSELQAHKAIPVPGAIEGKNSYTGTYIHYTLNCNNINFGTEWETVERDFTVPDQADGMQAICLNLDVLREINKYYFDDVTVYVEKEWEPAAESDWDILTWNTGKDGADATKFQVKYFKNYVATKSADGAVVVESLEPGKNYTPQYYMADNNGNEIDAVLANNWDTQFLIALPKPVAKGTKMKLSMLIKADKEASAESQAHGALPKAGAIEGKDGYGGTYMHYALLDNVSFTTDWKQFDKEFTVPDQGDNMQSICFNLDVLREVNKYYFKNIVVRVAK